MINEFMGLKIGLEAIKELLNDNHIEEVKIGIDILLKNINRKIDSHADFIDNVVPIIRKSIGDD